MDLMDAEATDFSGLHVAAFESRKTDEMSRLIQVALDRLPPRYGDVLEWKYVEGHSVKEIAARLDLGTEATQSLLARAKRAFADVYRTLMDALGTENGLVES